MSDGKKFIGKAENSIIQKLMLCASPSNRASGNNPQSDSVRKISAVTLKRREAAKSEDFFLKFSFVFIGAGLFLLYLGPTSLGRVVAGILIAIPFIVWIGAKLFNNSIDNAAKAAHTNLPDSVSSNCEASLVKELSEEEKAENLAKSQQFHEPIEENNRQLSAKGVRLDLFEKVQGTVTDFDTVLNMSVRLDNGLTGIVQIDSDETGCTEQAYFDMNKGKIGIFEVCDFEDDEDGAIGWISLDVVELPKSQN